MHAPRRRRAACACSPFNRRPSRTSAWCVRSAAGRALTVGAAAPRLTGTGRQREFGHLARQSPWKRSFRDATRSRRLFALRAAQCRTLPRRGQSLGMRSVLLIIKVPESTNIRTSGCSQRGCCALSGGAHGIPRPRPCLPVASFHAATSAPNDDPWPQLAAGRLLCGAVLDQPEMAEHVAYLAGAGGGVLFCVEPNGAAGPVGFFDCLGFFFSLLLRS